MTPEEEIHHAGDARHVIDNPVFQAAKASVYDKLRAARSVISTTDQVATADLVRVEQVADQFFKHFELAIQTGKMADHYLEQQRAQRSFMERGLDMFRTTGRNSF